MVSESGCVACRANRGELVPPGGVVWDDGLWRAQHRLLPAPVPGWLVLSPLRHVETLAELTPAEAATLGPLLVRLTRAVARARGAERVYVALMAEEVRHVHWHLVPRAAASPREAWGPALLALPGEASAVACARAAIHIADLLRAHHDLPA